MRVALTPLFTYLLLLLLPILAQERRWSPAAKEEQQDSWQNCEIFFAPSLLPKGGWGVFAGRNFEKDEIVEISPRYVALQPREAAVKNTVLNDYHHGHLRLLQEARHFENLACITFGKSMIYNHHVEPNLRGVSYGREPVLPGEPHIGMANGFVARRHIEEGEELFTSYGDDDGGQQWFAERMLEQMVIPSTSASGPAQKKDETVYKQDKEMYCSKVYAGFGRPAWEQRVHASYIYGDKLEHKINAERLAPVDRALAVINQDVSAGTVLEISPALVLSKPQVVDTLLAPMSFFWDDWDDSQKLSIVELRESKDLVVQQQDGSTNWVREDRFEKFGDVVVIPAGNIALVQRLRQGNEDAPNCKLQILSSGSMQSHASHGGTDGSTGILLQLVATKDLKTGDQLTLNVPSNASPYENQLLLEELKRSGHPVPDWLERYKYLSSDEF